MQTIYFATVDGKKPCLRPVTLIRYARKFWIATGTKDAKTKQIKKNGNIEFCLMLPKGKNLGYLRCAGTAKIVASKKTKMQVAKGIPYLKEHWKKGVDDPNFTLLEIKPKRAEYMRPGEYLADKFAL